MKNKALIKTGQKKNTKSFQLSTRRIAINGQMMGVYEKQGEVK